MPMIDRIKKIMAVKNLNPSRFADKIGVPRSTISHVLSGRNNPSLELVQKILDSFPDIKTEWLLRGKGYMHDSVQTLFPDAEEQMPLQPELENNDSRDDSERPGNELSAGMAEGPEHPVRGPESPENDYQDEQVLSNEKTNCSRQGGGKIIKLITLMDDGSFLEYSPKI